MIPWQDSSLTTTASTDLPVDFLDIVATQGAYLIHRPTTPVSHKAYDVDFVTTLEKHLNAVVTQQICRYAMYHEAANEWPIGHTPPEVKQRRDTELRRLEELEVTSNDGSDGDDECIIRARSEPGEIVAASARKLRSAWLPSPSLSVEDSLTTSGKRKRWTMSEEDDEKMGHVKKHVRTSRKVSAEDLFTPRHNLFPGCQKRQRAGHVADNVARNEQSTKDSITTTHRSNIWIHRLRQRREGRAGS